MIGRILAHYRIIEAIGAGGMGEVYRATDTKLSRDVALKMLPAGTTKDVERLERFRREAKLLAALDHPGIVTVYSVEEAEGIHFLTMQLVEGQTLDRLIPSGGMTAELLLDVASALAEALAAAHEKGVVHRDLKPSNVMVDKSGRVKILDFGLAKLSSTPSEARGKSHLSTLVETRKGVVMGTLPYMSPEQVQGRSFDHRTDIFSLGALLHEMATGKRPFESDNQAGLVSAILRDTPPPISSMRPDLPAGLSLVISRCLDKTPADRYQTTSELYNDLLALSRGQDQPTTEPGTAVSGTPTPLSGSTATASRKRWLPPLIALGAAVLAAGALVLLLRGGSDAFDRSPSVAVLPFADMSPGQTDTYLGDGMAETVINALVKIPELGVAARTSAFSFRGKSTDVKEIGRLLGVTAVLEGSVQRVDDRLRVTAQLIKTSDGFHLWSESFDRDAADIFAVQDEVAGAVVTALKGQLQVGQSISGPSTRDPAAYDAYLQGRFFWEKRTVPDVQRAISFFERAIERDPGFAEAWAGLADAHLTLPFYSDVPTMETIPKALREAKRALEINPELAEAHTTLAYASALYDWDWLASEREFRRAIEINPRYTTALKWQSDVLSIVGRDEEALEAVRRAAVLDPLSPNIQTILGLKYWFTGHEDEAMSKFDKALELAPDFPLSLMHKSWLCWTTGDVEQFFETHERLEKVSARPEIPAADLRRAYAKDGREGVLRLLLDSPGSEFRPVDRARWHTSLGDLDAAFLDLEQALEERDIWLPFVVNIPDLRPLHDDPRWEELLTRMNLLP